MLIDTARIPIAWPDGQRRGHAGRTGRVEFGTDVADKQDLPRLKLHVARDGHVAGCLLLGTGGRVVVSAQKGREIAGGGVGEKQFLGLDRAR